MIIVTNKSEHKAFNLRLPKDLWVFLRNESTSKEVSMNSIIIESIYKLKKRMDKKLQKT
jgi:hypothetical protein